MLTAGAATSLRSRWRKWSRSAANPIVPCARISCARVWRTRTVREPYLLTFHRGKVHQAEAVRHEGLRDRALGAWVGDLRPSLRTVSGTRESRNRGCIPPVRVFSAGARYFPPASYRPRNLWYRHTPHRQERALPATMEPRVREPRISSSAGAGLWRGLLRSQDIRGKDADDCDSDHRPSGHTTP